MKNLFGKWFGYSKIGKYGFPKGSIIIDVSFRKDYEQAHLNEAINIPLNIVIEMMDVIKMYHKTVVVVSNSNHTSVLAVNYISKQGISVFNGGDWTRFKKNYNYYEKRTSTFTSETNTLNNLS